VVDRAMAADSPIAQVVHPDPRQALLLDPAGDALREWTTDHRRKERQDVDLECHGAAPPPPVGGVALARDRRLGAFGRSESAGRDRGGRKSRASASITISPRCGAKIRMNARTAGRSNAPYGPSPTTKTSFSATR